MDNLHEDLRVFLRASRLWLIKYLLELYGLAARVPLIGREQVSHPYRKSEIEGCSETLVRIYKTTRPYIPKDNTFSRTS